MGIKALFIFFAVIWTLLIIAITYQSGHLTEEEEQRIKEMLKEEQKPGGMLWKYEEDD